ncbi:glycoside hydrolase family 55 protein [Halosquirtibacter laminarini]|uniref:Glycoside hydrolase family 55 protein n=1 Tax=Halosquirtibacter laminarini TaxID=3374600 RepID=A0AC61NH16_9BACT|nr:glycoside hydrolase family 55 protein [Prolixibacteraceae bacterium]
MKRVIMMICGVLLICLFIICPTSAHIRIYKNVAPNLFPQRLYSNLSSQIYWEDGFLDVTKAPYSAKGDGITDDTEAIQWAIDDAFASNLVVYVPFGTYLLSDQLHCIQLQGKALPQNSIQAMSQRKFGHILLGEALHPPIFRLKDNATVSDHILILFEYMDTNGKKAPSRHYLGTLRNFKIEMGNNPHVSAISNAGAQHCVLENIDISGNFDVGIKSLPGSGGYAANIKIEGGRIGIQQNQYRPCPTIFGIRLENQTEHAIEVLNTRGALTLCGFEIIGPTDPNAKYEAIRVHNTNTSLEQGACGDLVLVDGAIETFGSSTAVFNYRQNMVVRNVWFKSRIAISSGNNASSLDILESNVNQWKRMQEYVYATSVDHGQVHIDKKRYADGVHDCCLKLPLLDECPPKDLLTRHVWGKMPSWEDPHVDIVKDFGATRDDDSDDDGVPIQNAIDAVVNPKSVHFGKTIFIPRGHFHLKRSLSLKDGVKMTGAGKNISLLMVAEDWLPDSPVSVIETENDKDASVKLTDLGLVLNSAPIKQGLTNNRFFTLLDVKSGNFTMRDVQTDYRLLNYGPNAFEQPFIRFGGNAGGKIYGLCLDIGTKGTVADSFRHLLIKDTQNTLRFYQISVEDYYMSTKSEVGKENFTPLEVDHCNRVILYGFKYEGLSRHLVVKNSHAFEVYGGAGNLSMRNDRYDALFYFENTSSLFLANLSHDTHKDITGKNMIDVDGYTITDDAPLVLYKKTKRLFRRVNDKQ